MCKRPEASVALSLWGSSVAKLGHSSTIMVVYHRDECQDYGTRPTSWETGIPFLVIFNLDPTLLYCLQERVNAF